MAVLGTTPSRLLELTADASAAHLVTAPSADEWSASDVLAHLRACSDVWGSCIQSILTEDKPIMRGMDPRQWLKTTDYPDLEFGPSLRAFVQQRTELMTRLESLSAEGWARTAKVYAWGVPYDRTVLYYGERMARHERPHTKQIERLVAKA